MNIYFFILFSLVSYLIGGIPFGLLYARMRGVDIRKIGSGNIGSTNVSRQFGFWGGFVPVFLLDFLKGSIPVLVLRIFPANFINNDIAMLIVGILAIIGHMFPVYLRFKGGKGVATSAGVCVIITPVEVFVSLLVFVFTLLATRAISILTGIEKKSKASFLKKLFTNLQKGVAISSITAAIFFPISVLVLDGNRPVVLIMAIALAVLVVFQHRSNIIKMIRGENK